MTSASFANSYLTNANLQNSTLTNANFTTADLTGAYFNSATVTNANFTGAIIKGADLRATGFTASQLTSTASYSLGDLSGIRLSASLGGVNFAHLNLTRTDFSSSSLNNANFTDAI